MAYVTVAELTASLENAGGAGARTAAQLPAGRLAANLEEAVGEVTGRLRNRYTLPAPGADPAVAPEGIPRLMRTIIIGIAGYLATLEFYGTQEVAERDPVALRYARANALLADIARGTLAVEGLTPAGDDGTAVPSGDAAIYQGPSVGLASGWLEDQRLAGTNPSTPPYSGGMTWG